MESVGVLDVRVPWKIVGPSNRILVIWFPSINAVYGWLFCVCLYFVSGFLEFYLCMMVMFFLWSLWISVFIMV